jgi:superfamily II DNA or RNA helicase
MTAAAIVKASGLRPYQSDVIARIDAEIVAGRRRILMVAATGAGKTIVAGAVIADNASRQKHVLFLAHRRELIQQTSAKLHAAGVDHGIVQAGFPTRPCERVQIASISTLHARAVRSNRMDLPPADLVVVDEAHHCRAQTYRKLMAAYPSAVILGMTATPCRGDGRGLGNAFDVIVECPPIAELIASGFLVPTRVYAPTRPDLSGVHVERGDYVERELATRMNEQKLVGDVVCHWHRLAERRRTVVFATGVAHSVHLRDEFRASGVWAEHIDGSTPVEQRDAILARLAEGTVEVVTNAMVLTEGWDQPHVSCLVLARPTKHMGLYRQMVGRVLRPALGKVDALILDHAGAIFEHGFVEEPVIWTLAEDRRADNPVHKSRGLHRAPALATCPECSAVRLEGRPCTACGWRPQSKAAAVDVVDGELGHVDRQRRAERTTPTASEKDRWHGGLWFIANERARARAFNTRGWVYHKFVEKFGHKPPWGQPMPAEPGAEIRAWVRSRDIAFARAMAKRGAAA